MIGGYDELSPSVCADQAAEIVRRCNDYPALASRLERAMGLLYWWTLSDEHDSADCKYMSEKAAALLAEHKQETRP